MREKFRRFMYGRYGNDNLNQFLMILCLICMVISMFFGGGFLYLVAIVLLVLSYYRMFSRKIYKRAQENQLYLAKTEKIRKKWRGFINRMKQRRTHLIYKCPNCSQKIRIPRGKGRIRITCPKCRCSFEKNS